MPRYIINNEPSMQKQQPPQQTDRERIQQKMRELDEKMQDIFSKHGVSNDQNAPELNQTKAFLDTIKPDLNLVLETIGSTPEKGENMIFSKLVKTILSGYSHHNADDYTGHAQILLKACEYGRYLTVSDLIRTREWDKEAIQNALIKSIQHDNAETVRTLVSADDLSTHLHPAFLQGIREKIHSNEIKNIISIALERNPEYQQQIRAAEALKALQEKWTIESGFEISTTAKYGKTVERVATSMDISTSRKHYEDRVSYTHSITSTFNFKANYVLRLTKADGKIFTETQPFSHFDNDTEIREAHNAFQKLHDVPPPYRQKRQGPALTLFPKRKL